MQMRPRDTFRSPAALLCFFGTFVIGFSADLVSKSLAVAHLKDGARIHLIPSLIRLEYMDFARGFRHRPGTATTLPHRLRRGDRVSRLPFQHQRPGAVLSVHPRHADGRGAGPICGDPIGSVDKQDMIHGLPGVCWPAWVVHLLPQSCATAQRRRTHRNTAVIFNIADSLLCVGVSLLIVVQFFRLVCNANGTERSVEPTTPPDISSASSPSSEFDEQMMRRAIRLAMKRLAGSTQFKTWSVGWVVAKGDRVIGEGHYRNPSAEAPTLSPPRSRPVRNRPKGRRRTSRSNPAATPTRRRLRACRRSLPRKSRVSSSAVSTPIPTSTAKGSINSGPPESRSRPMHAGRLGQAIDRAVHRANGLRSALRHHHPQMGPNSR